MESRLLYITGQTLKHKIVWIKATPDNEWIYFGDDKQVNEKIITENILSYFADPTLYLISTRHSSFMIKNKDIEAVKKELTKFQSIFLWDMNFKKVIEFNHIGVMRRGEITSQQIKEAGF